MKVLNIGSLNLDYVYSVDHIIQPGETESTGGRNIFLGGKGINQSMALAKAGADIYHAGLIGSDGEVFIDACEEYGVNHDYIRKIDGATGHTIIQVDKNAQNCIKKVLMNQIMMVLTRCLQKNLLMKCLQALKKEIFFFCRMK